MEVTKSMEPKRFGDEGPPPKKKPHFGKLDALGMVIVKSTFG